MAAKRKTNTKKDLEDKIAELEAKLSKLSEQLDPPSATTTNEVLFSEIDTSLQWFLTFSACSIFYRWIVTPLSFIER